MRFQSKLVSILGLALYAASSCYGATVSGTVKGQDGAPIEGAFVQAQNTKTKISMYVLTDHQVPLPRGKNCPLVNIECRRERYPVSA